MPQYLEEIFVFLLHLNEFFMAELMLIEL